MARSLKHRQSPERITRSALILSGEPTIQGTRVPVRSVVLLYRLYADIERVRQALPPLSAYDVQQALTFYASHHDEIDRYIAENEFDDAT